MGLVQKLSKVKGGAILSRNLVLIYTLFRSIRSYKTASNNIKTTQGDSLKAVITLLPSHDNLGDHALAVAAKKMIQENLPNYSLVELDMFQVYEQAPGLIKNMHPDSKVFIIGGGNMGSLYLHEEFTRRFIFKVFKDFRRVQLPQSVSFQDSFSGKLQLKLSQYVYNKYSSNLYLNARDEVSYKKMKTYFSKCQVGFYPDSVMYLDQKYSLEGRDGIALCIREDKESNFTEEERESLIKNIQKLGDTTIFSTTPGLNFSVDTRDEALESLWLKISQAKVVVTDRLHGVIFAIITGTPVLALATHDHKLKAFLSWLQGTKHVVLLEKPTAQQLEETLNRLMNINDIERLDNSKRKLDELFINIKK